MQAGLSGIFEFLEYWWVRLLFRCFHSHPTHKKKLEFAHLYLVKTKKKCTAWWWWIQWYWYMWVLPHCTLETCDGTCRPVSVAFLNFWNTDESDYYSDVSTAIEHIKKNLSSPTSIYLVKTKQKTKVHSLLMMNPMIPIHVQWFRYIFAQLSINWIVFIINN